MRAQRRFTLVALLAVSAMLLTGCVGAQEDPQPPPTTTTPPTAEAEDQSAHTDVDQDPVLLAMLEELIVEEVPAVSLRTTDNVQRDCGIQMGGCYISGDEVIYLTAEYTDFRRPELLAHEYLHYVWYRDDLDDDAELTGALEDAATEKERLGSLVPPWQEDYIADDGSIMPTELFSYACTGLRSAQLAPVIAQRCEQYLRVDQLPINRHITVGQLHDALDALRDAEGLVPLENNPHAAAGSEARAALFTPYSQADLTEYPESVSQHLDAGCAPASYAALLTRPTTPEAAIEAFDRMLQGALTSTDTRGIGFAVTEFDYIDARKVFDDRTVQVNATLIVATACR